MSEVKKGKLIIFSAPSGTGKGTIINHLVKRFPTLEFSISATSRLPRGVEQDGVEYYFISPENFADKVSRDEFVEWEEVYKGSCYGTLRSEMERIWSKGNVIIFDLDVKGGVALKGKFGDDALALFVMPPSIEELRRRLVGRGTESAEVIDKRIAKASEEMSYSVKYDKVIVNNHLEKALEEAAKIVGDFIND